MVFRPDDNGDDTDLERALPVPEVRERRANPHMNKKPLRDMWYKGVPENLELKKRRRLIPEDEFRYVKLQQGEIRLLCLAPHETGKPSSPLYARVFTRRLEDVKGCYEALSYTWGDQSTRPREEIHLRNVNHRLPSPDRQKGEKFDVNMFVGAVLRIKYHRFAIYKNLHDALMQLRGSAKEVNIWVDAICIDQSKSGEEEKRQQLNMMDDIYKSAANVCVWVGPSFRGSKEGIELAREITNFQTFDRLIASVSCEKRWTELIKLLKLPWFSRRWIIQEIALAREATVHCGDEHIHWDDFSETVSLLLDRISVLRKSFRDEVFENVETTSGFILIAMLDTVCRKSDRGAALAKLCDLETLVSTLLGFQATNPRDAIFSVLSLARDPPQPGEAWEAKLHGAALTRLNTPRHGGAASTRVSREADPSMFFKYQLSTRDVFVAFVTRSIYNSRCLDLICRHWAPPVVDKYGKEVAMPSWVSPLIRSPYGLAGTFKGRQNSDNLVAYAPEDRRKRYNAAGSSEAVIDMVDDQAPGFAIRHPVKRSLTITTAFPTVPGFIAQGQSPGPITSPLSPVFPFSAADAARRELPAATNGTSVHILNTTEVPSTPVPPTPSQPPPSPTVRIELPSDAGSGVPRPTMAARRISANGRPRRSSLMQPQGTLQRSPDVERAHHLSGVLSVRGFVVGRVAEMSDVMRGGIVPGRWMEYLGAGGYGDGDGDEDPNRVPELLWRILVADRTPRGGHPPPWYRRACLHALNDPRKTDHEGNLHSVTPPDREISEHSTLYLQRVESVVWNQRLFRAELDVKKSTGLANGHVDNAVVKGPLFGIGPSDIGLDDIVCILLGCSVPVVLSPGKREGLYRVVGEAYVHGIMEGECMRLDAERQTFLLE
ncbi:uncharacterized protein E0L32_004191 [Thyridium curvatum]|uniref:Heterokaryon incompatibility domain-containing protein n=1 Tax=Thyridium curvatum TaxID=1093900 RepID=A0A507BAF9_9PEZI|nr:uncharacterized protein E0L32_004191 [Thyridium curvatum]TPX16196.1 hypothetical protein E0L32_004191 [Thyridium curvatum]